MKLKRYAATCGLALALCHGAALASTAKSYARIYDFSFTFEGNPGSTFVSDGPESTRVQAFNGVDVTFEGAPTLFAPLETTARFENSTGYTEATARSGSNFLEAIGFTNLQLGLYGSDAGYNSNSTQGGILRLAANTKVTLTGYFDLKAELLGPLCDSFGACSAAGAEVAYTLDDESETKRLDVNGESGSDSRSDLGKFFSLDFSNDSDDFMEIFFSLSVSIFGSTPDVIDDDPGGGGGGSPGGGGKVPAPSTIVLLALALVGMRLLSGQRAAVARTGGLAQPA